jgi:hypothetical protein
MFVAGTCIVGAAAGSSRRAQSIDAIPAVLPIGAMTGIASALVAAARQFGGAHRSATIRQLASLAEPALLTQTGHHLCIAARRRKVDVGD